MKSETVEIAEILEPSLLLNLSKGREKSVCPMFAYVLSHRSTLLTRERGLVRNTSGEKMVAKRTVLV